MKKNVLKHNKLLFIVALAVLALSTVFAVACDPSSNEATYKVTIYNGSSVLKVLDAKADNQLEYNDNTRAINGYVPEVAGKQLIDYYATPTFSVRFDFATKITKDTSIFASFKSAYQQDNREFAIMGTGKGGVLYSSNWGNSVGEAHMLTKLDSNTENKYKITVNLFAGDEFQIGLKSGLSGTQRGFWYIVEPTKGGVAYFENGGAGIGDDTSGKKSNIVVKKDGKYTLTLTTNPADDTEDTTNNNPNINAFDTIDWVRDGDTDEDPVSMAYDYFIKGAGISNWQNILSPYHQFSTSIFNTKYTKTIYLQAGDDFMLICRSTNLESGDTSTTGGEIKWDALNSNSTALFENAGGGNIKAKASGNYSFTLDTTQSKPLSATFATATAVAEDYYLNGKFGDVDWNSVTDNGFNASYKFVSDNGLYVLNNVSFAVNDVFTVQGFKAGSTNPGASWVNQTGNYQWQYMLASGFYQAENAAGQNFNVKIVRAGTYNISIDAYSKKLALNPTEELAPDVYIKGSMQDAWNHNFDQKWRFEDQADGSCVYTIELKKPTDGSNLDFGLGVYKAGAIEGNEDTFVKFEDLLDTSDAYDCFMGANADGKSGNIRLVTDGTYKMTYYYAGTNAGSLRIDKA